MAGEWHKMWLPAWIVFVFFTWASEAFVGPLPAWNHWIKSSLSSLSASGVTTVLTVDKLSKAYSTTTQLDDVSFLVGQGQRLGLIGANGAGKSTLLKCLAGRISPDDGDITMPRGTNLVFVEQEPDWGKAIVFEALFGGDTPEAAAARDYTAVIDPAAAEKDPAKIGAAMDAMSVADAWGYHSEGIDIATNLQLPEPMLYRRLETLSGGEKKRVALAAALLLKPNILLLDEPTNHLDATAIEWLAGYLSSEKNPDMSVVLVTHDRYFLDRVCHQIMELDSGKIHQYQGNYADYLQQRANRLTAEDAETERVRTKLRRESEWMAKQPKGRSSKSKARQEQFHELVDKSKGRETHKKMVIESGGSRRLGGVIAKLENISFKYHSKAILDDFYYEFNRDDRIGICGPNGVGKSTFLKLLTGKLQPDKGIIRLGETVKIGLYEQGGLELLPEEENYSVMKLLQHTVEIDGSRGGPSSKVLSDSQVFQLLTQFQFPRHRWNDQVRLLSGGERRRLQLLKLLSNAPNFLILDEPSNDLDMSTLSVLEEYLCDTFQGTVLAVSHDNYFVNKVCEHLFVFEGDGKVTDFQGSYNDYLDSIQ